MLDNRRTERGGGGGGCHRVVAARLSIICSCMYFINKMGTRGAVSHFVLFRNGGGETPWRCDHIQLVCQPSHNIIYKTIP